MKVTLDLPLITAGFDYLKISRISMDKQKALIGRSIDYSLQAMKPYWLKYIRDYLSTWRMIPSVKIDSIKLCLANFNNCKFDEVIQELLKIDCIITPLSNKTNDRSSSLNSLDCKLYYFNIFILYNRSINASEPRRTCKINIKRSSKLWRYNKKTESNVNILLFNLYESTFLLNNESLLINF